MDNGSRMEAQSVVIRFAGDSGDGVQLMGTQFVAATALAGNDFATFPDYPAEIRAPAGTTFGVSAYQIHLGARPITTAGDAPQVLGVRRRRHRGDALDAATRAEGSARPRRPAGFTAPRG